MRRVAELLCRPALVPLWIVAIAALVLLPDLTRPGLWEPHELQVADGAVARNARADHPPAPSTLPPAPTVYKPFYALFTTPGPRCSAAPTGTDGARTLTDRAVAEGLRDVSDTDGGMRLPIALLGILCVLATAGIALRVGGGRAGLIAGLACLSFPLFVLDARMLDGDIGTPTAAAMIVYGAVALAAPRRGTWLATDLIVSGLALAIGSWLGFEAGGALLGLLVPIGAVAAAEGLGLGLPGALTAHMRAVHAVSLPPGARTIALEAPPPASTIGRSLVALVAAFGAIALVALVAYQIYDITYPTPGQRELFGHSVIPSGCWSPMIGGLWKVDDAVNMGVDSVFEQIAYGTFPVGVLAPIAILALVTGAAGDERRAAGRLLLAWAAAAWVATQIWHRKVGFALWPGFPAAAAAIGLWLDDLLAHRERHVADAQPTSAPPLLAMFVIAAVATLAVDMWAFPDRMTSLLVGGDAIKYPTAARFLGVMPLRLAVCAMGGLFGLLFALGAWLWKPRPDARPEPVRWIAHHGLTAAIAAMLALSLFWVYGWHDGLSRHLSSKHVFSVYRDLRGDGDKLGIMGEMGNAPRYYAGGTWETIPTRDELMKFLARKERVFAAVPSSELCAIHRQAAGKPYFVLEDSNPRTLLVSNKLDGATDLNELSRTVLRSEPKGIQHRPPSPIVYDDKIELIGWNAPEEASFGSPMTVTLFFKVRAAVGGSWEIFEHFDPPQGQRFQGDHFPIHNRCATSYWQPGDYIVDENVVETGGVGISAGQYELWVGFFTGTNPNWTNMKVTQAPPGARDNAERVHLGAILLD